MTLQNIIIESFLVNPSDFIRDERSSIAGGYGEVTFQINKKTNKKYVVKKTKDPLVGNEQLENSFNREIQILAKHIHPSIVRFFGYSRDDYGYIYLEEIENGSISAYIKKNRSKPPTPIFTNNQKYIICYGIALAMQYLHRNGCIHRDLKIENILLDENLYPYVSDFGSSKDEFMTSLTGSSHPGITARIEAPELIEDNDDEFYNTFPIDVYSYGVTVFEIWEEKFFLKTFSFFKLLTAVKAGTREEISDSVPDEWKSLIENCWDQNPGKRPTFDAIVEKLESSIFLKNRSQKDAFLKYKRFLNEKNKEIFDFKTKIRLVMPTYIKNESLKKYRPIESSTNLDKIFKYIMIQSSGVCGKPDDYEIHKFSKKYLDLINKNKENYNDKNIMNKISAVEMVLGKSFASIDNYRFSENYLRRSINHGKSMSAFYLAELMSCKLINESRPNEINFLYNLAADHEILPSLKKLPFIQNDNFFFENEENVNDYITSIKLKYGIDKNKDINGALELILKFINEIEKKKKKNEKLNQFDKIALFELGFELYKNNKIKDSLQYFELAAKNGYPEGCFYYALIVKPRNKSEFLDFLKKAVLHQIPDAVAYFGKILEINNQTKRAIEYFFRGVELGSMYAMICLASFCESKLEIADANFYFEKAANCCHCLDKNKYFTPLNFKVFECKKCRKKICQACAKHCHKGHEVVEIGEEIGSKCDCDGAFFDKCTEKLNLNGKSYQHFFVCLTCCKNSNRNFICKNCIKFCHKGHDIRDCGIQIGFCSCGKHLLPNNFMCKICK